MRIFYVFWSAPAAGFRWGIPGQLRKSYIFYAYSLLLAKKNYPDAEIVVHTDSRSADFFRQLPYDEVITDLDELNDANPFFFAQGKIKAFESEPEGSLYIDGDVFLKSDFLNEVVQEDFDLLTQSEDPFTGAMYADELRKFIADETNECYGDSMLSCGMLMFRDEELKQAWIDSYQRNTATLAEMPEFNGIALGSDLNFELSTEQVALRNLSRDKNVRSLYPGGYGVKMDDPDYLHLYHTAKYHNYYISRMLDDIRVMDEAIWQMLEELPEE